MGPFIYYVRKFIFTLFGPENKQQLPFSNPLPPLNANVIRIYLNGPHEFLQKNIVALLHNFDQNNQTYLKYRVGILSTEYKNKEKQRVFFLDDIKHYQITRKNNMLSVQTA